MNATDHDATIVGADRLRGDGELYGSSATSVPAALREPARKAYRLGADRLAEPADTLSRFSPLAPALGITRLADVTGLDHLGIPVFAAVRPLSRNLAVSQGKGVTPTGAAVSAFMECAEMAHAERHVHPTRWASVEQLRAAEEPVAEIERLQPAATAGAADLAAPLLWTQGWDLLSHGPAWVPYETVHCDGREPRLAGEGLYQRGSNGLASGNTLVEAICHALYEVIERDELAGWDQFSYDFLQRRLMRLDAAADHPALAVLVEQCRDAGVEPLFFDGSRGRWPLPTVVCTLAQTQDRDAPKPYAVGTGTHWRREIATIRALTEAAQVRATVIAGSRDDIPRADYEEIFDPKLEAMCRTLATVPRPLSAAALPDRNHDLLDEDIRAMLDVLVDGGIRQAVVVDYTDPAIGLPVAKVVVPGLRHW